ncbi:MAG TPA: hypothetical protein PKE64_20885 [Anaerolineae bacterium]|nr:hypothetical protein [Anaerolineae bacterium]HMR66476.1 hypothetical protein [Anaerolineae bacterium]
MIDVASADSAALGSFSVWRRTSSRLALWDHLRQKYFGLTPDEKDRSGLRFIHG